MTESEEVARVHTTLVGAKPPGCGDSELTPRNVSVHTLPQTASFSNIDALATKAKAESYIGTVGQELVFSAHLGAKRGGEKEQEEEEVESRRPAKRRRSSADGDAARGSM